MTIVYLNSFRGQDQNEQTHEKLCDIFEISVPVQSKPTKSNYNKSYKGPNRCIVGNCFEHLQGYLSE